MSAFSSLLGSSGPRAPSRLITVPPSAFADSWSRKPHEPVKIGLRLCAEQVLEDAQRMAIDAACRAYPELGEREFRVEAFNDHLITNVLAQSCVISTDATRLFFAPGPEVLIREALTAGGIRRLWSDYERFTVEECPTGAEVTDDELAALRERMAAGQLGDAETTLRAKRLLKAVATMVLG